MIKLSQLYGEPNDKREKYLVFKYVWYIWYEDFGNGIALQRRTFDESIDEITLWSFSANANELVKNSYDIVKAQALAEEAKKHGTDNLDGL